MNALDKIFEKLLSEMTEIETAIWYTAGATTAYDMEEAAAELARITAENIAYKKVCDGKTPEEMDKWIVLMLDAQDRTKEKLSELTRAIHALKE